MIWLKRLFLWLMGLIFLLLIGISLLGFTHQGNKWLWQQARAALPALKGELVSGQLGYGWTLEGVGWQDELVDARVERAVLDWDLGKLLQGQLWIRALTLTHPVVRVAESAPSDEPPGEPFVWRPLPLRIQIDALKVSGLDVDVPGLKLALKELDIGARLDRQGLTVRGPVLDGLGITLTETSPPASDEQAVAPKGAAPEPVPASPTLEASSPQGDIAIELPKVSLPFPLRLEGLLLTDFSYRQGDLKEAIDKLQLSASGEGERIEIEQFFLRHAMADLDLKGQVSLQDDYPLDLTLTAKARKALLDNQLKGERATLTLGGSVGKLALALDAKGPVAATLKGTLQALDPDLPFDVKLNWPGLNWPLHKPAEDEASYQLKKGSLTAKGALSGYQFALNTSGQGTDVPPFKLALKGKGNLEQLSSIDLLLNALQGELKLDGKLAWRQGVRWQGVTSFKGIDPAELVPEIKGSLAGRVESEFALGDDGHWQLKVPALKVDGKLNKYPLAITGQLSGDDAMNWQIPAFALQTGPNQLQARGKLSQALWQLDARLAAPDLAGLYPGLRGDLNGTLTLGGNQQAPRISAALTSKRLFYTDTELKGIALNGNAVIGEVPAGKLALTVATLTQGDSTLRQVKLDLDGDLRRHQLSFDSKGSPLAARLRLNGGVQQNHWRGALTELNLRTPVKRWQLKAPWNLDLDLDKQRLAMSDLCLGSQQASLCIEGSQVSAAQGELAFALTEFDLKRLRPWLPDNFQWQAVLSADGRASWKGDQPRVKATLRTTPGTLVADAIKTPYQRLAVGFDLEPRQANLRLDFVSADIGTIDTDLVIQDPSGRGALSGQLKFDGLKLSPFAPLIPEVRSLAGVISADARFDGTLKTPLLFGQLNLVEGEVQTHTDMVTLKQLKTRLKIEGNRAELDGSMLVGKGPLALGGWLSWARAPIEGSLTIQGKALEAQYPGMGRVRVSPDLAISLGEQTRVTGKIEIPWARILVKNLPESAVARSDDVTIIYDELAPPVEQTALPLEMKVAVVLGDDIRLDAMGLKTKVTGGISLNQEPEKPLSGTGQLELKEGRFKAYGQNLIIREGRIIFSGPLDKPYLNIETYRDPDTIEDNVTVGVRVTGPAAKPKITVYSEPQMPQSEQLSYLLRGKGLQTGGEDGGFNGLLVAGAVGQVGGVVSDIGEALGMNSVALDTEGSGDNTQVTLSAYLLPGLQFQYGVGVFSPIAEFKLRYEVLPRLYLQAMSGVAQAVDIFYRFTL